MRVWERGGLQRIVEYVGRNYCSLPNTGGWGGGGGRREEGGREGGGSEGVRFRQFIAKSMRFHISIAKPYAP